jgi:hypothetical protein
LLSHLGRYQRQGHPESYLSTNRIINGVDPDLHITSQKLITKFARNGQIFVLDIGTPVLAFVAPSDGQCAFTVETRPMPSGGGRSLVAVEGINESFESLDQRQPEV